MMSRREIFAAVVAAAMDPVKTFGPVPCTFCKKSPPLDGTSVCEACLNFMGPGSCCISSAAPATLLPARDESSGRWVKFDDVLKEWSA